MASSRIPGFLCGTTSEPIDDGTLCRRPSPTPGPLDFLILPESPIPLFSSAETKSPYRPTPTENVLNLKSAQDLSLSPKGTALLQKIEQLRLRPYSDQTGHDITNWIEGATIGYGHLIQKEEWKTYKGGLTLLDANSLFERDLQPFVVKVRTAIKTRLAQQQFDALVMLIFNIGPANFASSSVVKLLNNPEAITGFANLEAAWKAWNKSQGEVMEGLDNRRQCEWQVYSEGVYKGW